MRRKASPSPDGMRSTCASSKAGARCARAPVTIGRRSHPRAHAHVEGFSSTIPAMTGAVTLALLLAARAGAGSAPPPSPSPALSEAEKERFLQDAEIVRTKSAPDGITGSLRAVLTQGDLTHEAGIQTID